MLARFAGTFDTTGGGASMRRGWCGVMRDQFRAFLNELSTRGGYCLSCLSEMYSESALTVARYLSEGGISSRQAICANCNERRETFRSGGSS